MKRFSVKNFLHTTNEYSEMLDNVLAQAEAVVHALQSMKSTEEREVFLDAPDSLNHAFGKILDALISDKVLPIASEGLWECKNCSERKGIFFLLSYLYMQKMFHDGPISENSVYRILQGYYKLTDISCLDQLEKQHDAYLKQIQHRKALPYYPEISEELDARVTKVLDILEAGPDDIGCERAPQVDDFINLLYREGLITENELINTISSENIALALYEVLSKKIPGLKKLLSHETYARLDEWHYNFIASLSSTQKKEHASNPHILVEIIAENAITFDKFLKLCTHLTRKIREGIPICQESDFFRGEKHIEKLIGFLCELEYISPKERETIEQASMEVSAHILLSILIQKEFFSDHIEFLDYVEEIHDGLSNALRIDNHEISALLESQRKELIHGGSNTDLAEEQITSYTAELIEYIRTQIIRQAENVDFLEELVNFLIEIENEDTIGEDFGVNIHLLGKDIYQGDIEYVAHEILLYVMLNYLDDDLPLMQQCYQILLEYYMHFSDATERIHTIKEVIHRYHMQHTTK